MLIQKMLKEIWFYLQHVMVGSAAMKTYKCIWSDRQADI